jgi:RNA polymerase sigma factor (TIGR02999 family)
MHASLPAVSGAVIFDLMSEVTRNIRNAIEQGDARQLLPLVYDELRKLAAQKLAHEKPGQTLQPTALVHEAYLRLVGHDPKRPWHNRGHFFFAAAEAMRRILVENARRKRSPKHGGGRRRHDAEQFQLAATEPTEDLLALDEALNQLAARDPVKAELVKLRYFAGMTIAEAAAVLGISVATAKRYWTYSQAWLYDAVTHEAGPPEPPA